MPPLRRLTGGARGAARWPQRQPQGPRTGVAPGRTRGGGETTSSPSQAARRPGGAQGWDAPCAELPGPGLGGRKVSRHSPMPPTATGGPTGPSPARGGNHGSGRRTQRAARVRPRGAAAGKALCSRRPGAHEAAAGQQAAGAVTASIGRGGGPCVWRVGSTLQTAAQAQGHQCRREPPGAALMYRRSRPQPNANKGRCPGSGAACEDADLPRAPEAPPDAIVQRVYRKGPQGWSLWWGMTVVLLGAARSQA